jgi:hypothetical protein
VTAALKVFFHDACFDGTASAALFARFYRDVIGPADLALQPMQHSVGDPFAGIPIDGDDNACVDFRFTADPRMRWWFDHHKTAFQPPELRAIFEGRAPVATWFFDPAAPSCAGHMARVMRERWGWTPPANLEELIVWADTIDAARFASAADATALAHPAQQLALWLGAAARADEIARYINALADGEDLAGAAAGLAKAGIVTASAGRARQREAIARAARWHGDVVIVDLGDTPGASSPGFLAYELFPACRYTVGLVHTARAVKIAIGWNPWGPPRQHDVGALCERFGGGGHVAVGGVTLPANELAHGRAVLEAIAVALAAPAP